MEIGAVILVHGIGDQRQGTTLSAFLKGLGQADRNLPVVELRQPADERAPQLAYAVARETINSRPVVIAEMFWSDLSSVRIGLLSTMRNFFNLAANLPEIVYASLGPQVTINGQIDFFVLRFLRSLVCFGFWTIYFPIVAYNLAFGALFSVFAVAQLVDPSLTLESDANALLGWSSAAILIILAALIRSPAMGSAKALLVWVWLALAAVAVFALWSANCHLLGLPCSPMSFSAYAAAVRKLVTLWLVPLLAGAVYLVCLPFLLIKFLERWRGLLLGFCVLYLATRFWIVLITTTWLVAINTLAPAQSLPLLDEIMKSAMFLGIIWLEIFAITIALILAFLLHTLRTMMAGTAATSWYPRLIVPGVVLVLPIGLGVFSAFAFAACSPGWTIIDALGTCATIRAATLPLVENAVWPLVIGSILIQFARSGFKIATDIVNYFKVNLAHREANPLAAMSLAYRFDPSASISFRTQLRDRMACVFEDLLRCGAVSDLHVVAHSLGTMVAIDFLRARNQLWDGRETRISLVTMGSPYGNVFHYYFPHLFPALQDADLPTVVRFTNIYRENDYVGTVLPSPSSFASERPKGPKGHFGYFEDATVLAEFVARV